MSGVSGDTVSVAQELEPPYGTIAQALSNGSCVPFLGAGASIVQAAEALLQGTPSINKGPPTGNQLSEILANASSFPEDEQRTDLPKVASYFVETGARRLLRERLRTIFNKDYPIGDIHRYLAALKRPILIVTTNYDDLIERAFKEVNAPYHLVVHASDRRDLSNMVFWWKPDATEPEAIKPNELELDPSTATIIYKMHGSVARDGTFRVGPSPSERADRFDSFVITEEDYVSFLSRMAESTAVPATFMRHFYERHFLFLGYGLRDWNLRVVLRNLRKVLRRPPNGELEFEDDRITSWAVQRSPSVLERKLWERRDVEIFNIEIDEFVSNLSAAPPFRQDGEP